MIQNPRAVDLYWLKCSYTSAHWFIPPLPCPLSVTLNSSWAEVRLLALGIHSVCTLHHRLHPCHRTAYKFSWQMMFFCRANMAFQVFTEFQANDIFSQGLFLSTVFSSIFFPKKRIIFKYLWNSIWILRKLNWLFPSLSFCSYFPSLDAQFPCFLYLFFFTLDFICQIAFNMYVLHPNL